MFTWIQRYFQRHFGVIIVVILAAMAIPLIVVFTPSAGGIGRGGQFAQKRDVFGYNLASVEDQSRLIGDASLSVMLQMGYVGLSDEQLQEYALQRIAALHLAEELGLPKSSEAEITAHIKSLPVFLNEDGRFNAQHYAQFRDSLKNDARIRETDVSRVIADDIRADKVRNLLAGPGYVLDSDIVDQLQRVDTTWTLELAHIDYASYSPEIAPTNDQLAKFFGDNTFRYQTPPRLVASYADFPLSRYLPQVSTNEAELRQVFDSMPGRFAKPAESGNAEASETPAQAQAAGPEDFALVRDQVEALVLSEKARQLATRAASDLTLALYEASLPNDANTRAALLAAHQVEEKPLAPFAENRGPDELGNLASVTTEAFKLNAEQFYSDAIPVRDGAVVLFWKELLPIYTPLLSEVLERVRTDYIEEQKREQFVELGRRVKAQIEARLMGGDSFAAAAASAAESAGVAIEASALAPFSLASPPQDGSFTAFNLLENLEESQVSEMTLSDTRGTFVYTAKRQVPDLTAANPRFGEIREQLAELTSHVGVIRILSDLVEQELRRSEPAL
ncbi:hypothetical protein AXK12_06400 [Cephaloticoccus capnophilus]|uniref:PpiC domain-containing protein n=1 Tax=Cephaloticoccus capnophilus TaxID=1548208 RepID=A0A139SK06_9BACT|nr:hypothetical protein [Cephaloticoccus capnophilus]KXU34866.1 hypothetical protein AXK12_06400 [Cephaloticoccus capnophilus]